MQLLPTDNKNTICATDTYFDYAIQKCSRYPYTGEVSIIYTVVNNVQHGHQMIVEYSYLSNMFLPGEAYQPQIKAKWSMIGAAEVEEKYLKSDPTKQQYEFDPIFMGDFKAYKFKLEMNDYKKHNFYLEVEQKMIPRKCLRVVDQELDAPYREIPRQIGAPDEVEDIELVFTSKRIDGCEDEYNNELRHQVTFETQPPLNQDLIDRFVQKYDEETGLFTVTIPKDVQLSPQMIKNVPIRIIIYMFWNTNELVSLPLSYMNIVYKVTLASEVKVSFKTKACCGKPGVVLKPDDDGVLQGTIDVNQYSDLIIDAQESFFMEYPDKGSNGLSFKWECAMEGENKSVAIQKECEKWDGSPVLQLPHRIITSNSFTNKPTIIKVVVSSIESSEANNFDVQFRSGAIFTWLTTVRPEFDILLPLPNLKDGKLVLVSQDQTITVRPDGWRSSDGYRFDYKLYNNNDLTTVIKEELGSNSV